MRNRFRTTREIGIDSAHRVTTHGSKCAHLHGHRYRVQVTVDGELGDGEESGMTLDFSFIKELMMKHIDAPADHGLILWCQDPWIDTFAPELGRGKCGQTTGPYGKTWVIDQVPTAENLAAVWMDRIGLEVAQITAGRCRVSEVLVWETPNCNASVRG